MMLNVSDSSFVKFLFVIAPTIFVALSCAPTFFDDCGCYIFVLHLVFAALQLSRILFVPRKSLLYAIQAFKGNKSVQCVVCHCPAAALFHGVIHLGYALKTGSPPVVAEGLGYWLYNCNEWYTQPKFVDTCVDVNGTYSSLEFCKAVKDLCTDKDVVEKNLITEGSFQIKMRWMENHFGTYLDEKYVLKTEDNAMKSIQSLRLGILNLYRELGSNSFVILHLITSSQSIEEILKYMTNLKEKQKLLERFFHQSLLAALTLFASKRPLQFEESVNENIPSVSDEGYEILVDRAIATEDEHVIKLAFVAKEQRHSEQSGLYNDTLYKTVEFYEKNKSWF